MRLISLAGSCRCLENALLSDQMSDKSHFESLRPFFPVILLYGINLYLAFNSWDQIRDNFGWVRMVPQSDEFKLRHFVQFTPLTVFALLAIQTAFKFSGHRLYLWGFAAGGFCGFLSEVIQIFIPQRIVSPLDFISNFIAALAGLPIYYALRKFFLNKEFILTEPLKEIFFSYTTLLGIFIFLKLGQTSQLSQSLAVEVLIWSGAIVIGYEAFKKLFKNRFICFFLAAILVGVM